MDLQLSKSNKKIAQALIAKGLKKEFEIFMGETYEVVNNWKKEYDNHQDHYQKLYKSVKEFDSYIARLYNDMRGSRYIITIQIQVLNGVLNETDMVEFSEPTRTQILEMIRIGRKHREEENNS